MTPGFRLATVSAALVLAVGLAHAGTPVTYTDGDKPVFSIEVPDFWKVRVGGDRSLTPPGEEESRVVERVIGLQPEKDSGVWIGFVSPDGLRTLDEAEDYARSLAQQVAKGATVTDLESRRIAGYPARVYRGQGRRDNQTVFFTVSLIDLPNGRVVFSMTALSADYARDALVDVNAIYNSIRSR